MQHEHKIDYENENIPASVKLLKPVVSKDGEEWCLASEEPEAGITGRGKTIEDAMTDFDNNWAASKEDSAG